MKKNILQLVLASIFLCSTFVSMSQSYEIRTHENEMGYIEVQMKETDGGEALPETTDDINDITFAVRWPSSYSADLDFLCATQTYNMTDPANSRLTEGIYHYRYYNASPSNFDCPENWIVDTWVTITTFYVSSGSGTNGIFEIAPQNFGISTLNWQILEDGVPPIIQREPTINGNVSGYTYPTIVYDFVWVGGATGMGNEPDYWNIVGNWEDQCGNTPSSGNPPYQTSENVYIPDVSAGSNYYPEDFKVSVGYAFNCGYLKIASGAHITVPDLSTNAGTFTYFNVAENAIIEGALNLFPLGHVTVSGSTTINSAGGIVVQATSAGVGSFIDNGTITYGGSGTATVQIYLSNSAGVGSFDIHLIGPTVDEENYTGTGTGAYLEEFILDGVSTYAYEWDESVVSTSAWVNLTSLTDEIYSGKGIGLSATDNDNHTLSMTGALMTGSVSSPALTYSSNHIELISNPYPSAIDFDGLAGTDNTSVVENKYWIWNPVTNAYVARAAGSGGTQYVQVGQGFFVETKTGGGTFAFTNARRAHSNDAFRGMVTNSLTVIAIGGQEGYKDEIIVRFDDYATSGYDIAIEAKKWESQNNDATQIRSIAEDNTELSINVLPTESLYSGMTSVPMHFSCGYNTEYSLSFFDIESFEYGTEIWLEDKQVGGDWVSVNDNPDYTFTATPDDLEDRFVIHFFGPTGVDEFGIENTVNIYSYRQNAFVRNNTNEVIKMVSIYTLSGELVQEVNTVDLKLSKFWVSNNMGYYVVRVITDKNVYTNKVFISK